MKRITLFTLTLIFLAAFSMVMGPQALQAQVHQMTPQMCTNLGQCSAMITEMTEMLKSGKLSPAEEREVINHIDQIGRVMQEMSSPSGPSLEKKHTEELGQIQDKWRRLREMKRGMQVKPGH
jgi:uncharacterized coiled-coil DUF342 family protein